MSISKVRLVFEKLRTCSQPHLSLLRIKTSKVRGTSYLCRSISLSEESQMSEFLRGVSDEYTGARLDDYIGVAEYEGVCLERRIYKLSTGSEYISAEYSNFQDAINAPDTETPPFDFACQAYMLSGVIENSGSCVDVILVSVQKPVTILKDKFSWFHNNLFKPVDENVLTLRKKFDILIVDNVIYFLTASGERLFDLQRTYKTVCERRLEEIESAGIVSDFEKFKGVASSGHNPRRFLAFNPDSLQQLADLTKRNQIAQKFEMPMVQDRIDTTVSGVPEKLVKVLCMRAMTDPFNNLPVEVAGAQAWH